MKRYRAVQHGFGPLCFYRILDTVEKRHVQVFVGGPFYSFVGRKAALATAAILNGVYEESLESAARHAEAVAS